MNYMALCKGKSIQIGGSFQYDIIHICKLRVFFIYFKYSGNKSQKYIHF